MLKISNGRIARAQKVVLYGSEGIGKSTLAAQFPNPLFIDTEGGTAHMDVRILAWAVMTTWVPDATIRSRAWKKGVNSSAR